MADLTSLAGVLGSTASSLAGSTGTSSIGSVTGAASGDSASGTSFLDILKDSISQSEELNKDSNVSTLNLLTGNADDLSTLLIGTQKSEIALSLTSAIRTKAVDAYKEIMNMQV
jgi:flagellar hook-basal body complex protein FliE